MPADFGPEHPDHSNLAPAFRTGHGFAPGESRYTDAVGREIVRRLEAGESLNAICRDPQMPAAPTLHKWAALHPAFAAAKAEAQQKAARRARRARDRKLKKRLARIAALGRRPPGPPSTYSDELGELICRRIAHGEALIDVCRAEGMPSAVTVHAWMRRDPAFAYMVALAREQAAGVKLDLAWAIARDARPETVALARLQIQTLRWQAAAMRPRPGPEDAAREAMAVIRRHGAGSLAGRDNPGLVAKAERAGDWD